MTANSIFGMQRANGDWFALQKPDGLCVPLFSSDRDAMQTRSFNVEMLIFKSVLLDERGVTDLAKSIEKPRAYFWLVEKDSTTMRRGRALTHAELVLLVRESESAGAD